MNDRSDLLLLHLICEQQWIVNFKSCRASLCWVSWDPIMVLFDSTLIYDLDLVQIQSGLCAVALILTCAFVFLNKRAHRTIKRRHPFWRDVGRQKHFLFLLPFRPVAFLKPRARRCVTEEEGSAFSHLCRPSGAGSALKPATFWTHRTSCTTDECFCLNYSRLQHFSCSVGLKWSDPAAEGSDIRTLTH